MDVERAESGPDQAELPPWVRRPAVITVEGLAATGKDTAARIFCEQYGYRFHNVSAVGRALAVGFGLTGESRTDEQAVIDYVQSVSVSVRSRGMETQVILDGDQDVTPDLFTEETSALSSYLLRYDPVPERVRDISAAVIQEGNVVVGGRRLAELVAPGSALQLYFVAEREERIRRRFHDRSASGATWDEVAADIRARDEHEIAAGSARPSSCGIIIDTTSHSPVEVVSAIVEAHNARLRSR